MISFFDIVKIYNMFLFFFLIFLTFLPVYVIIVKD